MKSLFAGGIGNRRHVGRPVPDRRSAAGPRSGAALLAGLLLFFIAWQAALPPAAGAGTSEQRLLSITKTTVYGALLGGILGLASALVVHEGYEDDAIRWGVALGAFSGFIYGAVNPEETDDFSLHARPERAPYDPRCFAERDEAARAASSKSGAGSSRGSSPAIGAAFSLDRAGDAAPCRMTANAPGQQDDPTR